MSLRVEGLRKRFGDVQALDGVSFTVARGEVFGFLGANGAGKTTTMRIALGLLRADEGSVTWLDRDASDWPRRTWGYMPEERGLYGRMNVLDQLVFFASLYDVPRTRARADALAWLARFRIDDVAGRRAETLSKGNQQKVQFIATVLHEPDVILMDEPFAGLDPVNVALLKAAFLEMRDRGKTIVFSTHQLEMAEELCDSVAIIDHGRLVTAGSTRDVKASTGHQVVRVATAAGGELEWLRSLPHVRVTRPGRDFTELHVDAGTDPQTVLRAAVGRGDDVLRFEVADPSLEEVFVERVGALDVEERTLATPAGVRIMSTMSHMTSVARREASVRVRTRTFVIGTVLLALGVVAIALVPVIVGYVEGNSTQRVAIYVGASDLHADPAPTLRALLNAAPSTDATGTSSATHEAFAITTTTDLAGARADVTAGRTTAVLAIERGPDGELAFTLYTNDVATGRTAQLIRQAATSVAVAERLERLGVDAADQASLFGPATYVVKWPDPTRTEPTQDSTAMGSSYLLAFGITLLIFMMIVLYGNWVAMSVVEEKSSRVMEVILNAATPFELLGGKVLGVGAAAFLQYLAILVAGGLALVLQDRVAAFVLGDSAGVTLPEGLTITLLVLFCVYGVLGFLLYAVLYAAAGSLVSRQEDVNGAVMPMTMITMVGYLIAVYAGTGLLDIRAGWVAVIAQIPFISPFIMPSRIAAGEAAGWEVALSIAILLATIPAVLWIAARVYAAGVLLYGQRPSLRAVWRLVRSPS